MDTRPTALRPGAYPGSFGALVLTLLGGALHAAPYTSLMWNIPDSKMRRRRAEAFYEVEMGFRKAGWPSEEFVYDEEHDLFRFADGEFAFSKEYANERRLRELGIIG